jgi:acyl dehydratase
VVGATAGPLHHEVDARWLMAYAASLGATEAAYLDTARAGGIVAHPLFPVCYEWPALLALRTGLPPEVEARAVHATHDLVVHRLPRAGDRLATTAVVTAVRPHRAGTLVVTRLETVDGDGHAVSTTEYGSVYRGVTCEATEAADSPVSASSRPAASATPRWTAVIPVADTLAHVYSECARIWNPIHTDRAVALAAGLHDVILHGTATLGLAVTELVRRDAGDDPRRVRRITGRFGAMVTMPSTLTLEARASSDGPDGPCVGFQVLTADGRPAIRDGLIVLGHGRAR